ncbi:MAG: DNA modification methylase [Candidatus Kapabacteria bacterium]|nr:DNA modification methylase [Ignavibacteriota bacterium]MCW5886355.1 DNA modification methylase [Candidatus Kapabacteria bacterium]
MNLNELNKRIIPLLNSNDINQQNMPAEELNNFINYKIFPREILIKADWNYKEEDEFTSKQLVNNLKKNGQIENIHVRKLKTGYYEVVNGNHRLDACDVLGKEFIIAYDHGNISLAQAQLIAIETNETKFKANQEKLTLLIQNLKIEIPEEDLKLTLPYDEDFLKTCFDFSNAETISIENRDIIEDDYDESPPEKPQTVPGDIYEFNGHRLMCGDSTSSDVDRLMNGVKAHMLHTDPPYNVKYAELNVKRSDTGKDWSELYCTDWNDDMSDADYKAFLINFIKNAKKNMIDWAHYYIWHATTYYRELLEAMEKNAIPYDKVPIQWVKQVAPLSWVRYKRRNEPCLFGGKGAVNGNGEGARWFGPNNEVTIWNYDREHNGKYIHPTQKPVGLPARAISNSSQPGEIVLELFGGSGSTLIAADQLKRKCYVMELSPAFCDAILKRYIKYCSENNIEIQFFKKNDKDFDYNSLGG